MTRRTLSEIYDAVALEKANMSTLNDWYFLKDDTYTYLDDHESFLYDLKSMSKVALWRLFIWITAVAIWIHEGLWFVFKSEVEADIAKHMPHTTRWYQEIAKFFQYGDELVWNDERRRYEYVAYDANKRIIVRSASEEGGGVVALKVARMFDGELAALSAEEKSTFTAYIAKIKDAGVLVNIISEGPDLLKLAYTIYYDPLVLNADGELLSDTSVKPIEDAINTYITTLDFNGRFRLEECDAAIREADGVIDYKRTLASSKYGAYSYTEIDVSRVAYAGYFKIDPAYPLADNVTYTANV